LGVCMETTRGRLKRYRSAVSIGISRMVAFWVLAPGIPNGQDPLSVMNSFVPVNPILTFAL